MPEILTLIVTADWPKRGPTMGNILIVDDEKLIQNLLLKYVRLEGHQAFIAENAPAAADLLKQNEIDLVITGIFMPETKGVELLETIRDNYPCIEVVAVTQTPDIETAVESIKTSILDYILKPISRVMALKTIRNAMNVKLLNDEKLRLEKKNQKHLKELERLQAEAMHIGHLAAIGEIAAGVAHEINNPVNGIISYAEILKDHCLEKGEDSEIPDRIIKEGDRIADILKNLLYFSRDVEEQYSPVNINSVLEDCLNLGGGQLIKDGIEIRTNLLKDIPDVVGIPRKIQQVFLNIISNARYALNRKHPGTHGDKILELTTETIDVSGKKFVRISFLDHGTGIPDTILEEINTAFFSTKPAGQGTGLGLSISQEIVADHCGNLSFESRENHYTKVIVDLPSAKVTP